jgi:hypothetical protein
VTEYGAKVMTSAGEETFAIPQDGESPQAIVDRFNATLKPGELFRKLLSWQVVGPVIRDDVEVFVTDKDGDRVGAVDRIDDVMDLSYVDDEDGLRRFLATASLGSIYVGAEACVLVLVLPDQNILGADLPDVEPESCGFCGADPDNMTWEDSCWNCGECGAVQ